MSRSALTREKRWWQKKRSISNSEKVIDEKLLPQEMEFLLFDLTWKVNVAAYPRLQGYWGNRHVPEVSWELGSKVPSSKN